MLLSINFCAVPAFILELPVRYSGPTITSIGKSLNLEIGLFLLDVMHPVGILFLWACLSPPKTYGVVPDAAIPIKKSPLLILYLVKSFQA